MTEARLINELRYELPMLHAQPSPPRDAVQTNAHGTGIQHADIHVHPLASCPLHTRCTHPPINTAVLSSLFPHAFTPCVTRTPTYVGPAYHQPSLSPTTVTQSAGTA